MPCHQNALGGSIGSLQEIVREQGEKIDNMKKLLVQLDSTVNTPHCYAMVGSFPDEVCVEPEKKEDTDCMETKVNLKNEEDAKDGEIETLKRSIEAQNLAIQILLDKIESMKKENVDEDVEEDAECVTQAETQREKSLEEDC